MKSDDLASQAGISIKKAAEFIRVMEAYEKLRLEAEREETRQHAEWLTNRNRRS